MKAMIYEKYGPPEVLQLKEVDTPTPQEGEVLIKVCATSVTKYDCWVRSCTAPPGFQFLMRLASGRTPKQPILGTELAGEVEAVGVGVTRFKADDPVFAYPGMKLGAYAEYICLPQAAVARKPENTTDAEAAAILQGGLTAWFFLRKADLQPGQKVLIFGASGGVGGYAVQLAARHFGAEVTGVCSTSKMDYVRSLGASHLVDYAKEDFAHNGQVYDVVFDTVGVTPAFRTVKSITPNGWYLLTTFGLTKLLALLWISMRGGVNLAYGALAETNEDLVALRKLVEDGTIQPIIDRCYPLEAAAEAHRYVESGRKTGNVMLTI